MYCDIHRRECGLFEPCPECRETQRRDEDYKKHSAALQDRTLKADKERHEQLEEERERRHQEMLDLQRERQETDERRSAELADLARERAATERARAEAEDAWREERREKAERSERQRQLREGLPSFDESFRTQWIALSEAIEAEEAAAAERLEQREHLTNLAEAYRRKRREAMWELELHLLTQPVSAIVVRPPVAARAAWQGFVHAYERLIRQLVFTGPGWEIDVSTPNLMAPWHLMHRMALFSAELRTTKTVHEHGLAARIPTLPARLPVRLVGCGALVACQALMGAFGMVLGIVQLRADRFVTCAIMGVIAVPLIVVLAWRLYVDTLLCRAIHRSICRLQESIAELLTAVQSKRQIERYTVGRDALFTSSEWTMQVAFAPLLVKLEEYLEETVGSWQATRDQESKRLLDQLSDLSDSVTRALKEKVALDGYADPPDVRALRRRFAYIESEIRRVGRQIISGLRVRAATIRLLQCPACSGPLSSETSSCPYCGSGIQTA